MALVYKVNMTYLWTLWELLALVFPNFDVIFPLIKSFYLIQRHVKWHCLWNVNCCTQERKFKVIQNVKFSQNRELCANQNCETIMPRKFHVIRYLLMFHSDYSFWFTFCLVYGTTLCWLWLLIMAEYLLLVVITGLFVVKKAASGREGSEEWVLFMEKCCRGLESAVRSLFMWLIGTQPSSISQVCPDLLLQIHCTFRSRPSFSEVTCTL